METVMFHLRFSDQYFRRCESLINGENEEKMKRKKHFEEKSKRKRGPLMLTIIKDTLFYFSHFPHLEHPLQVSFIPHF